MKDLAVLVLIGLTVVFVGHGLTQDNLGSFILAGVCAYAARELVYKEDT